MPSEMYVDTCKKCHRLFQSYSKSDLCPTCQIEEDKKFKVVRKYIREHDRAGITEVSEACSISSKKILSWVREERLCFSSESEVGIQCLVCGVMILTGKYCTVCKKKMTTDLKSVYVNKEVEDEESTKLQTKEKDKMHFLNKQKKR